jgi:hypothetical protein
MRLSDMQILNCFRITISGMRAPERQRAQAALMTSATFSLHGLRGRPTSSPKTGSCPISFHSLMICWTLLGETFISRAISSGAAPLRFDEGYNETFVLFNFIP